jgi:hypothetical protein
MWNRKSTGQLSYSASASILEWVLRPAPGDGKIVAIADVQLIDLATGWWPEASWRTLWDEDGLRAERLLEEKTGAN